METTLIETRQCACSLLNLGESYRLPHGAYTERLHARHFRRNQTTRCRSQSMTCWFFALDLTLLRSSAPFWLQKASSFLRCLKPSLNPRSYEAVSTISKTLTDGAPVQTNATSYKVPSACPNCQYFWHSSFESHRTVITHFRGLPRCRSRLLFEIRQRF